MTAIILSLHSYLIECLIRFNHLLSSDLVVMYWKLFHSFLCYFYTIFNTITDFITKRLEDILWTICPFKVFNESTDFSFKVNLMDSQWVQNISLTPNECLFQWNQKSIPMVFIKLSSVSILWLTMLLWIFHFEIAPGLQTIRPVENINLLSII